MRDRLYYVVRGVMRCACVCDRDHIVVQSAAGRSSRRVPMYHRSGDGASREGQLDSQLNTASEWREHAHHDCARVPA